VRGALSLLRPIIDTHHRLWDRGGWTYLLPELLADLNTGHNVVATVFEECRAMYRANGPVEMRIVGEVEFVVGIAAMIDSAGPVLWDSDSNELAPGSGSQMPTRARRQVRT